MYGICQYLHFLLGRKLYIYLLRFQKLTGGNNLSPLLSVLFNLCILEKLIG